MFLPNTFHNEANDNSQTYTSAQRSDHNRCDFTYDRMVKLIHEKEKDSSRINNIISHLLCKSELKLVRKTKNERDVELDKA